MTSELFQKLGGLPTTSSNDAESSENKLDMTESEAKRLEECFKDREFRDLLASYVEEISNPTTRLAYEEYLKQVERESQQPQNRKLVKPKPGFVIKLRKDPKKMSLTKKQGKSEVIKNNICLKVFVNCCFADCVENARLGANKPETRPINSTGDERAGICWQIPYILGHVRTEKDSVGKFCEVIDVAFSETTIQMCKKDARFAQIVIQTAIEAVETHAKFKFHPKYKVLKNIESKGDPGIMSIHTTKAPTLKEAWDKDKNQTKFIDSDKKSRQSKETKNHKKAKHKSKIKNNKNRNRNNRNNKNTSNNEIENNTTSNNNSKNSDKDTQDPCTTEKKDDTSETASETIESINNSKTDTNDTNDRNNDKIEEMDEKCVELKCKVVKPEYRIVESGDMNLQEYWSDNSLLVAPIRRPKRLILKIILPNLRNISSITANIITSDNNSINNERKTSQYFELIENSTNNNNNNRKNEKYYLKVKLPYLVVANEISQHVSLNNNFNNMSAKWYGVTKELHITLTVQPFSKQEINQLKEQMLQLKMKQTQNENKSNQHHTVTTDATDTVATQQSDLNQTSTDTADASGAGDTSNELDATKTCDVIKDVSAIDKILKLDASQLTQDTQSSENTISARKNVKTSNKVVADKNEFKSENKLVTESKKMKTKNKSKNKNKKKHTSAVQSGFLLNNKNNNSKNSKNISGTIKNSNNISEIKEMTEYSYEFRERLNRIVLLYRIPNIIESTVDIKFDKSAVFVSFETEENAYYKKFSLKNEIKSDECTFDVNCKNLLIMLIKKDDLVWNTIETISESNNNQTAMTTKDSSKDDNGDEKNENNKENVLETLLNDDTAMELE